MITHSVDFTYAGIAQQTGCLFFISALRRSAHPEGFSSLTAEKETYFFLEEAMEDEDKHSLEGVEDGEEVRHDDGGLVDEEEAEGPGQPEQEQQSEGAHDPGPEGRRDTNTSRRQNHR